MNNVTIERVRELRKQYPNRILIQEPKGVPMVFHPLTPPEECYAYADSADVLSTLFDLDIQGEGESRKISFRYHLLDLYVRILIRRGHKVAIFTE